MKQNHIGKLLSVIQKNSQNNQIREPFCPFTVQSPTELSPHCAPNPYVIRVGLGEHAVRLVLQDSRELILGRYGYSAEVSGTARLELLNASVSRIHAVIGVDSRGLYVMDVGTSGNGSSNGTYVDSQKLRAQEKYHLLTSQVIWLGQPNLPQSECITFAIYEHDCWLTHLSPAVIYV